jgi:hypothetical protein
VSVFAESSIEFDFTNATVAIAHDKPAPGHGNSVWPGVDFCIGDPPGWIWLEVKSWNPTHIPAKDRGGSRWSFISKLKSKSFTKEIRDKFLGTTAFLTWRGSLPLAPTTFILLFEPPHMLDAALLVTFQSRLKAQIPNLKAWQEPIYVAVVDLAEWNRRYPEYPARLL